MELSLSKLPWYGQIGAFVVVCGGGGVRLLELLRRRRSQADIEMRQTRLTALRADIAKGVATARQLPEFQAQVTELENRLENLRQVLPEEKDVADILRRIQGLATQSNLTIQRFTPRQGRAADAVRGGAVPAQGRRARTTTSALLRSDQQVPANHQRQRDHDQGQDAAGAEPHHRRRVHRDDVRAAGRRRCRQGRDGAEAAVAEASERRLADPPTLHGMGMSTVRSIAVVAALRRCAACRRGPGAGQAARQPAGSAGRDRGAPAPAADAAEHRRPTPTTRRPPRSVRQPAGARQRSARRVDRGRPGLPGLLIAEVTVKGIVRDRSGFIAMMQGTGTKTYIVRAGEKLMDGTVKAITADSVVFSQDVNDPLSLVKQREVRKTVRSADGGRE